MGVACSISNTEINMILIDVLASEQPLDAHVVAVATDMHLARKGVLCSMRLIFLICEGW